MNLTDLEWPAGEFVRIAKWYEDGYHGLMVMRHENTIYNWDMDRVGETFPHYIANVAVPGKLSQECLAEASRVTFYRMTSPGTMEEVIDIPFRLPSPEVNMTLVELTRAMLAELSRKLDS